MDHGDRLVVGREERRGEERGLKNRIKMRQTTGRDGMMDIGGHGAIELTVKSEVISRGLKFRDRVTQRGGDREHAEFTTFAH